MVVALIVLDVTLKCDRVAVVGPLADKIPNETTYADELTASTVERKTVIVVSSISAAPPMLKTPPETHCGPVHVAETMLSVMVTAPRRRVAAAFATTDNAKDCDCDGSAMIRLPVTIVVQSTTVAPIVELNTPPLTPTLAVKDFAVTLELVATNETRVMCTTVLPNIPSATVHSFVVCARIDDCTACKVTSVAVTPLSNVLSPIAHEIADGFAFDVTVDRTAVAFPFATETAPVREYQPAATTSPCPATAVTVESSR